MKVFEQTAACALPRFENCRKAGTRLYFSIGARNVISVCLSRFVPLWQEEWIPKPARRPRHVCREVHGAVTANWPRVVTYRRELQIIFRAFTLRK